MFDVNTRVIRDDARPFGHDVRAPYGKGLKVELSNGRLGIEEEINHIVWIVYLFEIINRDLGGEDGTIEGLRIFEINANQVMSQRLTNHAGIFGLEKIIHCPRRKDQR